MPGRTRYEGLTLGDRGQSTDFDSAAYTQVVEEGPVGRDPLIGPPGMVTEPDDEATQPPTSGLGWGWY